MSELGLPNFSQPATLLWIEELPPPGIAGHGTNRQFARLDAAIAFVMEEVPDEVRPTAMILTDGRSYALDQIETLYLLIYRCPVCNRPADLQPKTGDREHVDCPNCGTYDVSESEIDKFRSRTHHERKQMLERAKRNAEPGARPMIYAP